MDISINNINKNLHNIDLIMLGNKGKKYNYYNNPNDEYINEEYDNIETILQDFKNNKKEIKNKINQLYTHYLDISNGNIKINNKINGYFYLFIKSILDDIKNETIKTNIQNELVNYNNKNKNSNKTNTNKTNTNSINSINNNSNDYLINSKNNKNINIEQYLDIKKINNVKILPKKRY